MKTFKFITIIGIILFMMVGCSKEKSSQVVTKTPTLKSSLPCAFSGNPYDSVGYLHNDMLTYLLSKVSFKTYNDSLLPYASVYLHGKKDPLNFDSCIINTQSAYQWYTTTSRDQNFSDFLTKIGKDYNASISVRNYLDSIYQKLNLSPDKVIGGIISVEEQILNDDNLSQGDQHTLLVVASVSRYSYYFWENYTKKKSTESSVVLGDLMGAYYGLQYGWMFGWGGVIGFAVIGSALSYFSN
jgi:hypothetical protein